MATTQNQESAWSGVLKGVLKKCSTHTCTDVDGYGVIGNGGGGAVIMAANWISGLHEAFVTVRQTNAAHVSALDALERSFTAETALFVCCVS